MARTDDAPIVGAFAIIPNNDLAEAVRFWKRLGFAPAGKATDYVIMRGWGCEVHLTQAGAGEWRVPEANPFGVYLRTPDVAEIAARVDDLVIRPGGVPPPSRMGTLRGRRRRPGRAARPNWLAIGVGEGNGGG